MIPGAWVPPPEASREQACHPPHQLYLPRLQGIVQPQPPDVGVSACEQRKDRKAVTGQLLAMWPEWRGSPSGPGFLLGQMGGLTPPLTGRKAGHAKCSVNQRAPLRRHRSWTARGSRAV